MLITLAGMQRQLPMDSIFDGQESNGQKCSFNLFFLCSQRYKFSGFTLGGLFLHPAHNESVFLIIIKKDPTKGKFIVKLQGTGYQQKG